MIADVLDRHRRRIGVAVAVRERVAVARQQRTGPARLVRRRQRVGKRIGPGADDGADLLLQRRAVRLRRLAAVAADDEMHAGQRPFREVRIDRR